MLWGLPRSNELGYDPRTRASPLPAPLPLAPPVPGLFVDLSRSALPELLLATPPAILYDADV